MSPQREIGVGIAGFGLAGRYFHAPFIAAAGMSVRAVVTSRREEVRNFLPSAEVISRFGDLIVRDDIDLVVVATPNALHFDQVRAALNAGKAVVVDKPATPSSKEARELDAIAQRARLPLAVYHNRRWDSDFLTMKRLLADGSIGAPMRYATSWNRHRAGVGAGWREQPGPASGVLYDLGAHLIDQALQLFGRPDWIAADVYSQRAPGTASPDDGFEIHMARGELRITLASSSLAAGPGREIRLDGTRASYLKASFDAQAQHLFSGKSISAPDFGEEPEAHWGELWAPDGTKTKIRSERGAWVEFYRAMRSTLESGTPVPVTMSEAAQAIEIIELVLESARSRRRIALN